MEKLHQNERRKFSRRVLGEKITRKGRLRKRFQSQRNLQWHHKSCQKDQKIRSRREITWKTFQRSLHPPISGPSQHCKIIRSLWYGRSIRVNHVTMWRRLTFQKNSKKKTEQVPYSKNYETTDGSSRLYSLKRHRSPRYKAWKHSILERNWRYQDHRLRNRRNEKMPRPNLNIKNRNCLLYSSLSSMQRIWR